MASHLKWKKSSGQSNYRRKRDAGIKGRGWVQDLSPEEKAQRELQAKEEERARGLARLSSDNRPKRIHLPSGKQAWIRTGNYETQII